MTTRPDTHCSLPHSVIDRSHYQERTDEKLPRAMPFVARAPNHFTSDIVGAELTFAPDTGPAQPVMLRQWGQEMQFERVAARRQLHQGLDGMCA
ncbi:MAG TPA: hypothetical protein VFY12_01685 [Arenimonas sp.]|nr:hypothetical protein [Arenimonas sp.]